MGRPPGSRVKLVLALAATITLAVSGTAEAKKKGKKLKLGPVVTRSATGNATGNEAIATAIAVCPGKMKAVGGGFLATPIDPANVTPYPFESQKVGQKSWRVSVQLIDPLPVQTVNLTAYVYCRLGAPGTSTESVTLSTPPGPVVGPAATLGCDPKRRLVGGGFATAPPVTGSVLRNQVIGSQADGAGGWVTTVISALSSSITGYAYCAKQKRAPSRATSTVTGQPFNGTPSAATASCVGRSVPLGGGFSQTASFGPTNLFRIYESQRVPGGWRVSALRTGTSTSLTLSSTVLCG